MKNVILIILFLVVTPLTLGITTFAIVKFNKTGELKLIPITYQNTNLYAALPQNNGQVLGIVSSADARPIIIEKYLQKFHSPLLPYSQNLLSAADKYNVDYRLIMSIAQCESNLCKKSPPGSYNCWGFENGDTHFLSWQQALDQVAKTLKEGYLDQGLTTPEQIMPKYAPPSVDKGGPWARCVSQFMNDLDQGKIE